MAFAFPLGLADGQMGRVLVGRLIEGLFWPQALDPLLSSSHLSTTIFALGNKDKASSSISL